MASYIDIDALSTLLKKNRGNKGLREVAQEMGNVSPSTLSRIENGKMPDLETFLRVCDWLELPPANFIKDDSEESVSDTDTSDAIAMQLRADKNLDRTTANALAEIFKAAYRELSDKKISDG